MDVLGARRDLFDTGVSTFLAVVRNHTLSRAGEHLHVSQSTVSYRIQALERRLGVELFKRGRGSPGVQLTADGEAMVDLAERWEALYVDIQDLSRRRGALSIGAPDSVHSYILGGCYADVAKDVPEVHLRMVTANSGALFELLDRHEIDLAFTMYSRSAHGCKVEEFLREEMVVVAAAPLSAANGKVQIGELDPEEQVGLAWPDPESGLLDNCGSSRISVDTVHLVRPFLANPRSWVLVPESMASELAEAGGWNIYSVAGGQLERVIFKVVRTHLPRAARESYELFEKYLDSVSRHWHARRVRPAVQTSSEARH